MIKGPEYQNARIVGLVQLEDSKICKSVLPISVESLDELMESARSFTERLQMRQASDWGEQRYTPVGVIIEDSRPGYSAIRRPSVHNIDYRFI